MEDIARKSKKKDNNVPENLETLNLEFSKLIQYKYSFENNYAVLTIIENNNFKDYSINDYNEINSLILNIGYEIKNEVSHFQEITDWKKESETDKCILIDFDKKLIFVCENDYPLSKKIELFQPKWENWKLNWQKEGIIFHFKYTNRDTSLIKFTINDFEQNKESLFTENFPENK